jgi:hypothetical protein
MLFGKWGEQHQWGVWKHKYSFVPEIKPLNRSIPLTFQDTIRFSAVWLWVITNDSPKAWRWFHTNLVSLGTSKLA